MAVLQAAMSAKNERKPRETANLPANTSPKPAKQLLLVAQDVKFARALAYNDKKLRDRALKRLKKWFQQRYTAHPFTEDDFMRIWKGLFYSMWMSDKALIQEECAENITRLVHFPDAETSLLFFKCGLQTLAQEWFGIDQLRLDKFLMFARRLLRQGFVVLKNAGWKKEVVARFGVVLLESVLRPNAEFLGLKMHFTDIYLEELAKVSEGRLGPATVTQLILPFAKHLALLDDFRGINHIKKHIFHYLIKQSDKGLEYEERFEAWRRSGFAGGSINSVVKQYIPPEERIPEEQTNGGDKPLDPRAGRVNVDLPQLKFSCEGVVNMLGEYKFIEGSSTKSRKTIATIINEFSELAKGRYPLDVKKINVAKDDNFSTKLKHSVNRLVKFEKKLMDKEKKPKKRKSETDSEVPKKKKKRRSTVSDEDDHDLFARKLQEFMENAERKVRKNINKRIIEDDDADLIQGKSTFKRNSGTWIVTEENTDEKPSISSPKFQEDCSEDDEESLEVETPSLSSTTVQMDDSDEENGLDDDDIEEDSEDSIAENLEDGIEDDSEDSIEEDLEDGIEEDSDDSSVEEEEEVFDCAEYYETLLDTERKKREKMVKEANKKLKEELVVENPFSKPQTPSSTKKVKIALDLNQSQEIHEHQLQVLRSPAIPFDTNKKPIKPVLKPSPVSSPINPFYRKKIKLFSTSS